MRARSPTCIRCGADEWRDRGDGKGRRCIPCHRRSTRSAMRRRRRWQPEWGMWWSAKTRAKKKGVDFRITVDHIVIPARCPVLGLKLQPADTRWSDNSPTLDRVDPKRGYVPGNVQVISHRANRLKSDGTAAEHTKIAAWQRKEKRNA